MTTHQGHDHPNTKAGRAACRRASLQGQPPKTDEQGSKARHPAGKAHTFELNVEAVPGTPAATKCVCGKAETAMIHQKAKTRSPKRGPNLDPALPHQFDSDALNPKRCYVCKRNESANVHSEGPRDLARLFTFGARR